MDGLQDLRGDLLARAGRIDDDEARRLGLRKFKETVAQTAVEELAGLLDAVRRRGGGRLARGEARPGGFGRDVEEDREVGLQALRRKVVEVLQPRHVDAAAVALVGEGRIGETVAQHPFAPRERGADHLGDDLRARREEEQHLAARNRRIRPLLPDERADLLGDAVGVGLVGLAEGDLVAVELVVGGGESDTNARPLDYSWVLEIREQCVRKNVSFEFRQCGTHFIKDGKEYKLQTKDLCSQARKAGIDFKAHR